MLHRIVMALTIVLASTQLWAGTQFRVIVDASGSMLISDPDRLTAQSLQLITNLAPEKESTLGVWLFGEQPRVLVPEAPVTEQLRTALRNNIGGYVTEDLQTDLESVLELLLAGDTPQTLNPEASVEKHWILVTDGMVDISLDEKVNEASRNKILSNLLPKLIERGVHLHTISMTGYTDKDLLRTLSLSTNATHTEVAVPEDLLSTFNKIFSVANTSDEIPFEDNRFFVDKEVKEFTLLVFHEPGQEPIVVEPGDKKVTLIDSNLTKVVRGERYTLITIKKPLPGTWKVDNVDLQNSSIRVVTDLSAQATQISPVVFLNESLYSSIGLFQEGALLKDPVMLDLVSVSQKLVRHTGDVETLVKEAKLPMAASQFKNTLENLSVPGDYELVSLVDGKTFSRKLSQYFTVYKAVDFAVEDKGNNLIQYAVKPTNLRLSMPRSNVLLELTYQDGNTFTEEMPVIGQGYWEKVIPISHGFRIKARARLAGVTQTGKRFDYWTPTWTIVRDELGVRILDPEHPQEEVALGNLLSESREVMPAFVAPEIELTEVTESDDGDVAAPAVDTPIEEEPNLAMTDTAGETEITGTEIALYAALNVIGLMLVFGGGWIWKRRKQERRQKQAVEESV